MAKKTVYPSSAQQQNLLTLLCFDKEAAQTIRGVVDIELFESSVYRDIAEQAFAFLDQYRRPVGHHLPDVLDHILSKKDSTARLYRDTILSIYNLHKEGINREYVLGYLSKFVTDQNTKLAVIEAGKLIKRGDTDLARLRLTEALRRQVSTFDPGRFVSDASLESFFDEDEEWSVYLGMPELRLAKVGPQPKTLTLFVAPTGRGKTWFCVHTGKHAAAQRKKTLHVTLELSAEKTELRYIQAMLSVSRRRLRTKIPYFKIRRGVFSELGFKNFRRPSLDNPKNEPLVRSKLDRLFAPRSILIKRFQDGMLTMPGLRAYLNQLEDQFQWSPDVVIIDYPDKMKVDQQNLRLELNRLYVELRGLMDERNCAGVVVSQTNRSGENTRVITRRHLAEDYSKAQIADIVMTYNQTEAERQNNLARIYVDKNRDEEAGQLVLISQSYGHGQFVLRSAPFRDIYWQQLENMIKDEDEGGGDGD